jgi:DNA repair photolyase
MKIQELKAESIIVPSNLPDVDYVINPYTGCQFGCIYCYATFMGRFVNEPRSNWGNYVYVKANAVELAGDQLHKWGAKRKESSILFSSVTDPYQGVENKFRLTRGILGALVESGYLGPVSILTKSPLVSRDVDLLKRLNAEVGLTVTTTDDRLSRYLEVSAPQARRRLATLEKLGKASIRTYAFVGPLLPHFRYQPNLLGELFGAIAGTGAKEVYVEHLNLTGPIKNQIWARLKNEREEIQTVYEKAQTQEHREVLDAMVAEMITKHDLRIRYGGTIYHPDLK